VEPAENDLSAVRRELLEELGVTVLHVDPEVFRIDDHGSFFTIAFVRTVIVGEPRALEHDELLWATAHDLSVLELAPVQRRGLTIPLDRGTSGCTTRTLSTERRRPMGRCRVLIAAAGLTVCQMSGGAAGQVAPKGTGFQLEYLAEVTVAEDHLVRLAEVIPAELYTWRPAPGVRSVSEVLLHVAGSNFNLPRALGIAPAEGMVGREYAQSTTDKAAIVAALKESFVFLRTRIEALTPADAERKIAWFDGENTFRGVLYFMARHTGEHTGQLIAYARMNGIVPPWSGSG